MKFSLFHESRIGRRSNNEDRLGHCYSRDALLLVIADGMGGHLHGEVAAQVAVQYLIESFQREATPHLTDPFLFLARGLDRAHQAILDYAMEKDLVDSPRTTCVACIVQDNLAYWAHAGDSRLYHVRGKRILNQTRDHSRVQSLIDQGLLDERSAQHHPERNRIYSCLGGPVDPQIDFSRKTPLQAGDRLLLCTDGFWGPLGNERIANALGGGALSVTMPRLLDEALAAGGPEADNLSVIVVDWEESYGEDTTLAVETHTMPLDAHTTLMEGFDRPRAQEAELTDDEIERAIAEIRSTIEKYSK